MTDDEARWCNAVGATAFGVAPLTIDGKLKLGFKDDNGLDVAIPVISADPLNTNPESTGTLAFPASGGQADAAVLNAHQSEGVYYIDATLQPGANQKLDYAEILDSDSEITAVFTPVDGSAMTLTFNGVAQPIVLTVDGNGISHEEILTPTGTETQEQFFTRLSNLGIQRFRFRITNAAFVWVPGAVNVTFAADSWKQKKSDGTSTGNAESSEEFTILGPTVTLANPTEGGHLRISEFDGRMYLDLTFTPTKGASLTLTGATAPAIWFSGTGAGTAMTTGPPVLQTGGPAGTQTFRYTLSGEFALGEVVVNLDQNTFADSTGAANVASNLADYGEEFTDINSTAGLVASRRDGSTVFYRLADDRVLDAYRLLQQFAG